ncbi:hypothetical protein IVA79_03695 [Bradyrhizobium sp. 138]|uniref:hypothetical protein n=1 Tax=Bradyrhizobium sp. 138 TaxID=2782615 RepID=UPI001FF8ACDE|nr:hypothetical protein [Bradyrhizobium sp. 138]MCK1733083.1 hypothetical protein [Bradyrhizobium sp. 138]
MLAKFLEALPTAAASPFAFIAYVFLVATFGYLTISQYRLRNIARIITAVPESDRAALLAKEYNTTPTAGMTAQEWIAARRQALFFWLAMAALMCALIIIAIAFQHVYAVT